MKKAPQGVAKILKGCILYTSKQPLDYSVHSTATPGKADTENKYLFSAWYFLSLPPADIIFMTSDTA